MIYTIGALGDEFGLSRSTLLYYDKIGLLTPSTRSASNYRCYTESDRKRLAKIMTYRDTGMSLHSIAILLGKTKESSRVKILEVQVERLNEEIDRLRKQQQMTIALLQSKDIDRTTRSLNKERWVELLESIGMSEEDMWRWHQEFERRMPQAHQDFLESLNISTKEIGQIRRRSRKKAW